MRIRRIEMNIEEHVAHIKKLRHEEEVLDLTIKERMTLIEQTADYQKMLEKKDEKKKLSLILAAEENDLHQQAIMVYKETGNKNPVAGVIIKIFHNLKYDPKAAEEWARVHTPAVFKFDKTSFEKVAVELGAPVTVEDDPRAQISSKL
jgi:hypothetical protein